MSLFKIIFKYYYHQYIHFNNSETTRTYFFRIKTHKNVQKNYLLTIFIVKKKGSQNRSSYRYY